MRRITKLLFLIVCLLHINFIFSQVDNNVSQEANDLLKKFQKQEQERNERIELYFNSNPNAKRSISNDEGQIIYIYDILDGKPIYRATDNLDAGRATKTNHLHPGGSLGLNLDGSGMTIGVWDGGPVQASHPEFANATNTGSRVTVIDPTSVSGGTGDNNHGTHVAGTISAKGVNPSALGMATNVNVKSYNWTSDESEMISAVLDPTDPIIISNHSYGVPIDPGDGSGPIDAWIMGAYTQDASDIDNIAKYYPKYLIVASAGNGGNTNYTGGMFTGFDKLTTDKNAKNNLVVANASPTLAPFTYELSNLTINSGSSQGPTDDLRIKPDLAGDGTGLFSTISGSSYDTYSGTSMSSPNVAGSLLLLQEYYFQLNGDYMNSSTLKGLVCHTSIDDGATAGPDPRFGWGFLDSRAAAEVITQSNSGGSILSEITLDNGQSYTLNFSAQAGEKLMATICWTDMPGVVATNGVANDQTPRLVNDLDLRLSIGATTYLPWKLDYSPTTGFSNSKADNIVDTVERIEIDVPQSGVYTLTVTHKGTLQGVSGGPFDPQSQDFGLIVTGSNLSLSTSDFALNSFKVWPNPANDFVNISFLPQDTGIVTLSLIDSLGRTIKEKNISNSSEINEKISLLDLSKGVYFVKITQGNFSQIKKIIH